ncbi:hypothetical protein BJ742DRAFT_846179 [Cladochytrium replicatum]|nr:hypothetical protein BJ742DRAFT_846179 [Cladochytrium replicatum]
MALCMPFYAVLCNLCCAMSCDVRLAGLPTNRIPLPVPHTLPWPDNNTTGHCSPYPSFNPLLIYSLHVPRLLSCFPLSTSRSYPYLSFLSSRILCPFLDSLTNLGLRVSKLSLFGCDSPQVSLFYFWKIYL